MNTALGYSVLNNLTTGHSNTCVGGTAGSSYTSSESDNILISNSGVLGESNVLRIGASGTGNFQQTTAFIGGIFGNSPSSPQMVTINSSDQLGSQAIAYLAPPAYFHAYLSTNLINFTGDGTNATIVFDTVSTNVGSGYNNSTGVFTAPVTGLYHFTSNLILENMSAANTSLSFTGVASSGGINVLQLNPTTLTPGS